MAINDGMNIDLLRLADRKRLLGDIRRCFVSKWYIIRPLCVIFVLVQDMDGEAVIDALGSHTGPDCLRDVLPKYGQRIKVYKAINDQGSIRHLFFSSATS